VALRLSIVGAAVLVGSGPAVAVRTSEPIDVGLEARTIAVSVSGGMAVLVDPCVAGGVDDRGVDSNVQAMEVVISKAEKSNLCLIKESVSPAPG